MQFLLFFRTNLCCSLVQTNVYLLFLAVSFDESCQFVALESLLESIIQNFKKLSILMVSEELYFQFLRQVFAFEEIFEYVLIHGH